MALDSRVAAAGWLEVVVVLICISGIVGGNICMTALWFGKVEEKSMIESLSWR